MHVLWVGAVLTQASLNGHGRPGTCNRLSLSLYMYLASLFLNPSGPQLELRLPQEFELYGYCGLLDLGI